jgi:hypothetical protein
MNAGAVWRKEGGRRDWWHRREEEEEAGLKTERAARSTWFVGKDEAIDALFELREIEGGNGRLGLG